MALKKADVARFKQRLEELRDQLTNMIRDSSEDVKSIDETKGYSQHQADEGTDDFNRTISLEVTSKEFGTLRQIERAMEKIEDGTYGVCDITGEEIPMARLEAIPYATMTVKAQEKFEKGLL
ncbi:MAG: TraR/DksA family transcriptional regulator [Candidatus Melainabacteria bacterium]|nr:TraR/DksA family transcriptional regulator [Candidatus Melainabacteria bacterium]